MKDAPKPPQASLLLRILGGGYLVYLAWDLRASAGESLLFLAAIIVFAVVGLLLAVFSIRELLSSGYFRNEPEEISSSEESEESTNVQ